MLNNHQHTYQNISFGIVNLNNLVCTIYIYLDNLKDINHNYRHYILNTEWHHCLKHTRRHKLSMYCNLQSEQDNYQFSPFDLICMFVWRLIMKNLFCRSCICLIMQHFVVLCNKFDNLYQDIACIDSKYHLE